MFLGERWGEGGAGRQRGVGGGRQLNGTCCCCFNLFQNFRSSRCGEFRNAGIINYLDPLAIFYIFFLRPTAVYLQARDRNGDQKIIYKEMTRSPSARPDLTQIAKK